jgi:hypothetical protein
VGGAEVLRFVRWMLLGAVMGPAAWEQSLSQTPIKVSASASIAWKQKTVKFSKEKVVLGLPPGGSRSTVQCSSDNTAFFNLFADSTATGVAAVPEIFGISTDGEVKHLLRKLPLDFNSLTIRDFFVGGADTGNSAGGGEGGGWRTTRGRLLLVGFG